MVEYNSYLGEGPVTVPEGAVTPDTPKGYSGASLAALAKLGSEKGYRLVGCDHMGVNAFFVRDGVAPELPGVSATAAWRPNLSRYSTEEVPRAGAKLLARIRELGLPLVEV